MNRTEELLQTKRMSTNTMGEGNFLRGLYKLIQEYYKPDFEMVEIGCFEGASTELFLLNCRIVHAVDPWSTLKTNYDLVKINAVDAETTFRQRVSRYDNIKIIKTLSEEAAKQFDEESLDAVYIDGDHRYSAAKKDMELWSQKVKKGGIISGHDYGCGHVKKAILETLGTPLKVYEDGSWVCIK